MSNDKITKAEQIIMDYTASTKWDQIEKIHWTTAEVMDVFDTYFRTLERSDNSDYEAMSKLKQLIQLVSIQEDIDPAIQKLVNDNFMDLL